MHFMAYVLVPRPVEDVNAHVEKVMEPYAQNTEVQSHQRKCECVLLSGKKVLAEQPDLMLGRLGGPCIEFIKAEFDKQGFEESQLQALLKLGNPDPNCEECHGAGAHETKENPKTEWDYWDQGPNVSSGELTASIRSSANIPPDSWVVPIKDLDLDKIPVPRAVITPDGEWNTSHRFIWYSNAVVIDENWEANFRSLLEAHKDSTLVVLNCHI